ncbi:MAG: 4-alpha-glucanotransferase [Polyangiaceae bacterium]|nr:4-alpha-glucanotransferase [Polyangiaceae bacterium]
MKGKRLEDRSFGVLAHPTSLAGPFESGDLGPSARRFVDFLASAGVGWWQVLPLGPAGHGGSPYSSTSVFAGSANLVSLESLRDDGLLDPSDPALAPTHGARNADLVKGLARREEALKRAFQRARSRADVTSRLDDHAKQNGHWLDDYALFAALKRAHGGEPYFSWPEPIRRRDPAALEAFRRSHADEVALERFIQLRFTQDLDALVAYARDKKVSLMGDAPIYGPTTRRTCGPPSSSSSTTRGRRATSRVSRRTRSAIKASCGGTRSTRGATCSGRASRSGSRASGVCSRPSTRSGSTISSASAGIGPSRAPRRPRRRERSTRCRARRCSRPSSGRSVPYSSSPRTSAW